MITDRVTERPSLQMDKYYQQLSLDRLVLRYKSFLEKNRLKNSFDQAEHFLQDIPISEAELKAMGIRSRHHLAITITNTSLPNWY